MAITEQYVGAWTTALIDQLESNALSAVAKAVSGIPVIGSAAASALTAWADDLSAQATAAYTTATAANTALAATNTQLSLSGATAMHASIDSTADVSIPYSQATDNMNINSTQSVWGYIRITKPGQDSVVTYSAYVSGTVTALYFDIYQLNVSTGDETLIYSTADQSSALGTSYSLQQFVIPSVLIVNTDDVYAVQPRMAGSGTVWMQGKVTSAVTQTIQRPYNYGAIRNPSSSAAPSTIPGATADTLYSPSVTWFSLGSVQSAVAAKRVIADDFSNGLGNWVLSNNSGSNLTVSSGALTYNSSSDGTEFGLYQTPLLTANFDCSFTVSSASIEPSVLVMASDDTGTTFVALTVTSSASKLESLTGGWSSGTLTQEASGSGGSGNYYVTYRSGVWTVYSGVDTTGTVLMTWTEPTSGGPSHGAGHRFFGALLTHAYFTAAGPIDNFSAKDV